MYESILFQNAVQLLEDDIVNDRLPNSLLFSGPACSGKLSAALETARILSCTSEQKGSFNCTCSSCLKHKVLGATNVLLCGPSIRTLEIEAAKNTLITQYIKNSKHLNAARFLYVRAVRKLTMRFSSILWEDEKDYGKITPLLETIENNLERLDPLRPLPEQSVIEECCDEIKTASEKLESSYLYDSLPVNQVRNISVWAHMASISGKKTVIIENADSMADSSRNALLKILEEPPADMMFILLSNRRGSILPTILSRVRTYNFIERSAANQREVIDRAFHYFPGFDKDLPETIDLFLQGYLPVKPESITFNAMEFFKTVSLGKIPDIQKIYRDCSNFEPRVVYRIFMTALINAQKDLLLVNGGAEVSRSIIDHIHSAYNSVTIYNQNPQSALESLVRDLMFVNRSNNFLMGELFK